MRGPDSRRGRPRQDALDADNATTRNDKTSVTTATPLSEQCVTVALEVHGKGYAARLLLVVDQCPGPECGRRHVHHARAGFTRGTRKAPCGCRYVLVVPEGVAA